MPWPAGGGRRCRHRLIFSAALVQVVNPATGKAIATVPLCGANETRAAIAAAASQFETWGRRPGKERSAVLRRCEALPVAANLLLLQLQISVPL